MAAEIVSTSAKRFPRFALIGALAVCLLAVLACISPTTALADEENASETDESVTYNVVMLADAEHNDRNGSFDWEWLSGISEKDATDIEAQISWLANALKTTSTDELSNQVVSHVTKDSIVEVKADGKVNNLLRGWYLIWSSSSPAFVKYLDGEVALNVKHAAPTIYKDVYDGDSWEKAAVYGYKDHPKYRVGVTVPEGIEDYEKYPLDIYDAWDEGLSLVDDSVSVTFDGKDITDQCTVSTTESGWTVNISDLVALGAKAGSVVEVTYDMDVTSAAYTVLDNKAFAQYLPRPWSNIPDKTVTVRADVYGVHVIVSKVDEDKKPLAGAKFTLARGAEGENGEVLGTFESDTQGKITNLPMLGNGAYNLTETEAPSGYEIEQANTGLVIEYKLNDGGVNELTATTSGAGKVTSTDAASASIELEVVNPKTGKVTPPSVTSPSATTTTPTRTTSSVSELAKTGATILGACALLAIGVISFTTGAARLRRDKSEREDK